MTQPKGPPRLPPDVRDRIIIRAALDRYCVHLADELLGAQRANTAEDIRDAERRLRNARATRVRFVESARQADLALVSDEAG